MYETHDVITKHHCHQPLEGRWDIVVALLHYQANEQLKIVTKAVFRTSSGQTHICLYASDISNLDLYVAHAMSCHMVSWSGKGETSFSVLLFCMQRLNTVHNLPFFLRMQSMGIACHTIAGTHQ